MPTSKLLVVALALAPALQARAAAPRIGISAEPRQVELVSGARARLRISAPEVPVLSASVGSIDSLKTVAPGRYEATYVPPREAYPQIAIIVATTQSAYGWLALPLAGTGEVVVKAGADGMASVTIGKTRFGPVRADASGNASIHVVVPPGIRYAMSGSRRMSLNTPEVSHVFVAVDHATVPADRYVTMAVRVFAVTPEGKPRQHPPVAVTATAGELDSEREVEPGVVEYRWSIGPGTAGQVSVEARLKDEPKFRSRATVLREPSSPKRLVLTLDRTRVVAGEGPLDFVLTVEDAAGNAVDEANPRASTSLGTFLGWTRIGPGRWRGRVAVPERLSGYSKMEIVATAGDVVVKQDVPLLAGPPADVTVDPSSADATGGGAVTFAVTAVDRFGNPTDHDSPRATASLGTVDAPVRQGPGVYRLTYHPPAEPTSRSDEVVLRDGTIERVVRVRLAEPRSPFLTIAPKVGGVAKSGAFGPAAGGEIAMWGRLGGEDVGLTLEGTWFRFSQSKTVAAPAGTTLSATKVDGTQSYIALTLSPTWRRALGSRAMLWLSAGGGMVNVHSTSSVAGDSSLNLDEATWVPAVTGAVSLGARAWGGYPFLEFRASYVGDPKLKSLSGSFVPLFLTVGYRFDAF